MITKMITKPTRGLSSVAALTVAVGMFAFPWTQVPAQAGSGSASPASAIVGASGDAQPIKKSYRLITRYRGMRINTNHSFVIEVQHLKDLSVAPGEVIEGCWEERWRKRSACRTQTTNSAGRAVIVARGLKGSTSVRWTIADSPTANLVASVASYYVNATVRLRSLGRRTLGIAVHPQVAATVLIQKNFAGAWTTIRSVVTSRAGTKKVTVPRGRYRLIMPFSQGRTFARSREVTLR